MTSYEEYTRKAAATRAAARAERNAGRFPKRPTRTRVREDAAGWWWECRCGQSAGQPEATETLCRAALATHEREGLRHRDAGYYAPPRMPGQSR